MPLQMGIIKNTNQEITYTETFPYMSRGILHIKATNCPLFYFVYSRFMSRLFGWLGLDRNPAAVDSTEFPFHRVETTILFAWKILAVLKKMQTWETVTSTRATHSWRWLKVCLSNRKSSVLWPCLKVPGDFGKYYNKSKEFSGFNR